MTLGAAVAMLVAIVGGLAAVSARNIVHAVFGLGVCLCGVSLAFLALRSPFVAAMEVLIYIGGITVAMVFAVMLSTVGRNEPHEGRTRQVLAGAGALAFFAAGMVVVSGMPEQGPGVLVLAERWSVEEIGRELLNRFNLVFEVLSLVLLLAIMGAITIAGRSDRAGDPAGGEGEP